MAISFFIARQNMLPIAAGGMAQWRAMPVAAISRNARDAASDYPASADRGIEPAALVDT